MLVKKAIAVMKIIVTAGPTREAIDPVRFISNRSTGKMGFAIASCALARGHDVCLIAGPVSLDEPRGARVVHVVTAEEMFCAVDKNLDWCDVLVMTAAVADWRPVKTSSQKLKKCEMTAQIELERTKDILAEIKDRKKGRVFVGFSADTENNEMEAIRKLNAKNLDLIVANDVSRTDSGFGVDNNEVFFITPDRTIEKLPLMSKSHVAARIISWVESMRSD